MWHAPFKGLKKRKREMCSELCSMEMFAAHTSLQSTVEPPGAQTFRVWLPPQMFTILLEK